MLKTLSKFSICLSAQQPVLSQSRFDVKIELLIALQLFIHRKIVWIYKRIELYELYVSRDIWQCHETYVSLI